MKNLANNENQTHTLLNHVKERRQHAKFLAKYGQIGSRPGFLPLIATLFLTLPPKKRFFRFATHKSIIRHWKANRYPEDLSSSKNDLPPIELLTVVAGKDLNLLPFSLVSAVQKTLNPITCINIIIPAKDREHCEKVLSKIDLDCVIKIITEDIVIDEETRKKLKIRFKDRYGWVLQQLLAVKFIVSSQSRGVLLLNADTILIREAAWLQEDNSQKLLVALEFHEPYYKLLHKLIGSKPIPKTTHVTHHMLFQPAYLREIFQQFSIINIETLASWFITNADPKEESPLCTEFELYAQGMLKLHPDKIYLRKFSNISVERSELTTLDGLNKEYANYNSVSMHSYLVSDLET
jgi:hypothetical protein